MIEESTNVQSRRSTMSASPSAASARARAHRRRGREVVLPLHAEHRDGRSPVAREVLGRERALVPRGLHRGVLRTAGLGGRGPRRLPAPLPVADSECTPETSCACVSRCVIEVERHAHLDPAIRHSTSSTSWLRACRSGSPMPRPGVSEPPPKPAPQSRTTTVSTSSSAVAQTASGPGWSARPYACTTALAHASVTASATSSTCTLGGAGGPRERGDVGPEPAHLVRRRGRPALVAMLDDDGPLWPHGYWQVGAHRAGPQTVRVLLTCDRAPGPGPRSSRRSSSTWRCISVRARFAWRARSARSSSRCSALASARALCGTGMALPSRYSSARRSADLAHEPRRARRVRDQQVQHRVAPGPLA